METRTTKAAGQAKSDFSIGHRGAALQFPEHTRESYEAGARMGAGILKCVTPAVLGASGEVITPASAECRTSELTLAEFKTLTGKMDAFNPAAQTPAQYLGGTPDFGTNV